MGKDSEQVELLKNALNLDLDSDFRKEFLQTIVETERSIKDGFGNIPPPAPEPPKEKNKP